jgi:hypothetical protein
VAALRAVEQQRADVLAQLEHLDGLARAGTPWGEDVRSEIRRRMTEWRAMLLRHPGEARQILRKLIVGRLTMTPRVTAEDPGTKSPARQRMARC